MKKYTAMIVEDDPDSVEQLMGIIAQTNLFTKPFICSNSAQAMAALCEHSFDILFLDIELPDLSALDLLRMSSNNPPVCIISNYPAYAIDCYEVGVSDFIVKPASYLRVLRSVSRLLKKEASSQEPSELPAFTSSVAALPKYIYLKTGRQFDRFMIDDIVYLESYHIYTKLFTCNNNTVINEKISTLEEKLGGSNFIRIHKSYLINLTKVTQFTANTIWLDMIQLPIGGVYKNKIQERLKELCIK